MGFFSDLLGDVAAPIGGLLGGPLGGIAGTVIGGIVGGKAGGQAQGGTQTVNRDPWLPAQDWMKQNLQTGQALQNQYAQNPFNGQQIAAYNNLASGNDYINRLVPGLLQQMSQPVAFNRNNPSAMPSPFSFYAPSVSPQMAHAYGGMMQQSAPMGVQQMAPKPMPAMPFMLQADAKPAPMMQGQTQYNSIGFPIGNGD